MKYSLSLVYLLSTAICLSIIGMMDEFRLRQTYYKIIWRRYKKKQSTNTLSTALPDQVHMHTFCCERFLYTIAT